ncbi:MAG: hypothetical protein LBQ21_00235 [Clostridiales Family XIII bacterium]|nr:hypothetical protein [Clostridiales Family XIII bacterium]
MEKDKSKIIISASIVPPPEEHEISAAWILARHFNCAIEFLKPLDGYKRKTPDFVMRAVEWEIKSPTGHAKRTIRNNLDLAKAQSPNIVLDARRTNLPDEWIEIELKKQCVIKTRIYRLIMITKDEKVVEIKMQK